MRGQNREHNYTSHPRNWRAERRLHRRLNLLMFLVGLTVAAYVVYLAVTK